MRAEPDGTRVETRFRLSPKRTSPFESAGESVQSIAGSRVVRISVSNAGYTTSEALLEYWLPTPFASFPFTSPPVRHRVPPGSERALRRKVQRMFLFTGGQSGDTVTNLS